MIVFSEFMQLRLKPCLNMLKEGLLPWLTELPKWERAVGFYSTNSHMALTSTTRIEFSLSMNKIRNAYAAYGPVSTRGISISISGSIRFYVK